MKYILLALVVLCTNQLNAQSKRGKIWVSATGGQRVHFDTTVFTSNLPFIPTYFTKGNSNICDTNGNLILSSNGYNIYDSNYNFIENGDTIIEANLFNHYNGWSLYSQTSMFLPMDSDMYYFITPSYHNGNLCFSCFFDVMQYSIVDMKANGGAGKVVKRMIPFAQNGKFSRTQMMACRHSNGKDWWLLKQGGDSNIVYKYLFTLDSVYDKGREVFNEPLWGIWDIKGQTTISKDGSRYASACQSDGLLGEIFIADFDRCYGKLSNPIVIQMPIASQHDPADTNIIERSPVALAFSPSGEILYVIGFSNIFQYDLSDGSWTTIAGLDTTYQKFQYYSNSYLGPDDKLYIGNEGGLSKQMSVINNPNVKGAGCNFCPRCLRFPDIGAGTPPCMPNYSLGAKVCFPDAVEEVSDKGNELLVYPNPTSSIFYIKNRKGKKKELFNAIGQLMLSSTKDEIEVKNFCKGVYYLVCEGESKKVVID